MSKERLWEARNGVRACLRQLCVTTSLIRKPVGSRALVEKYRLGVSPATVRNDMSVLEDEGLIAQPHTSAGRIPTDLGYRTFVNSLQIIEPLSPSERRAMERLMDGAVDLDDVIARAVRLLAGITHQAAVVHISLAEQGIPASS